MTADPPTPDSHAELISEPITPTPGTFDTADMGKGLPGLPVEGNTPFVTAARQISRRRAP